MLDCIIRDGTVIDGSGCPRIRADISIENGRIVSIGKIGDSARREIDAGGCIVAPGFIDIHTHYDAQVMWDPALTPSSLHGVTTIIGGNCGFTLAPVDDSCIDYVTHMLSCVEGMPGAALESALRFDWRSYGEWLNKLEGRLGVNAGFMAGHSTIRRLVMGKDWLRPAVEDEIRTMSISLAQAIEAGAIGFSSSWGGAHGDHLGNPVPSRFAQADELIALAQVLRSYPGTSLEFIPPTTSTSFEESTIELMAEMAIAAGRPLNWNLLAVGLADDSYLWSRIEAFDRAAKSGGQVAGLFLPIPLQLYINLRTTVVFNSIPLFQTVLAMAGQERLRALSDPAIRARVADAIASGGHTERLTMNFSNMTVESVVAATLKPLEGRRIGDIAAERNCAAIDAFLDIAVKDDLRTCFKTPQGGTDDQSWRLRNEIWNDPRVLVGGSDAGAHLDSSTSFAYFTDFVGPIVRERHLLDLETAVHKITEVPARFYGLRHRGRLAEGNFADIVIFDEETVRTGKTIVRDDLPGGQSRLFADAIGIERVMVGGEDLVVGGILTGALPGKLLRSGKDTAN